MLMKTGGGEFPSAVFRSSWISGSSPVILAVPATSILATGGLDVIAMLNFKVNWPVWWSTSEREAATSKVTEVSSLASSLRRLASTFLTRTSTSTICEYNLSGGYGNLIQVNLKIYAPPL